MIPSLLFALGSVLSFPVRVDTVPVARNVLIVTLDGLRWQELFAGADSALLAGIPDSAEQVRTREAFWRGDPITRRQTLLPFFWTTVARNGQVFGNRFGGGSARVTNGKRFSYPGYNELLAGFPDDRIDSNNPVPNPNLNVLEWLNGLPAFRGSVAAFGAWNAFTAILNAQRSRLPVNAGWAPLQGASEETALLNRLQAFATRTWPDERDDAITYLAAREYLTRMKPRVLYLALGDTDEWAHGGRYGTYLDMARRSDEMLRDLWLAAQSLPEYRGQTAIILATDHGRGDGARWTDHGRDVLEAEFIWFAVMGPGVAARGLRDDVAVTQGQFAATVARLLGENFRVAAPRAAPPLPVFAAP